MRGIVASGREHSDIVDILERIPLSHEYSSLTNPSIINGHYDGVFPAVSDYVAVCNEILCGLRESPSFV